MNRLAYANVMSTLAVFIALGGSSYAALTITGKDVKDGSLTGKDVRKGSITGGDLKAAGVTSSDIKDASLTLKDFKPGQIPAGQKGDPGLKGDLGLKGDPGLRGDPGLKGDPGDPVTTLYTAGTGLVLNSQTFSADTSYLQRRLASGCTGNAAIRSVAADGTVTCTPDPPAVAGAIVNPNGTTQGLTPSLTVSRTAAGAYSIRVPKALMDIPPMPTVTVIGGATDLTGTTTAQDPNDATKWLVTLTFPADRLFNVTLTEVP